MHYVYTLIDPRDGLPFYVGKGKNKRSHDHLREARLGKCNNKHLEYTIKQIWNDGYKVEIEIVQTFDNEVEAFLAERDFIASIGRRDLGTGPLVNLTAGGEGIQGKSKESVAKSIAKMMATKAAWTDEEREIYQRSVAETLKRFWEHMTDAERHAKTQHIRTYYDSLSDKDKEQYREQHRQYQAACDTPEWRARITETCKRLWDNPATRLAHGDIVRSRKAMMSPEAKTKHRENVREAVRQQWAAMTPEQRDARMAKIRRTSSLEIRAKISESKKATLAKETVDQKRTRIQRHKEGAANVDWKTINKKTAIARQEWSDERKAEHRKTLSASAKRGWERRKNALIKLA